MGIGKKEVRRVVTDLVNTMTTEAKRQGWVDERWYPAVECNYKPTTVRSQGGLKSGRPWLVISCFGFVGIDDWLELALFHEYDFISGDPEIGSLINKPSKQVLAAVIAHEISHSIAFSIDARVDEHGIEWQHIYRHLRTTCVNA